MKAPVKTATIICHQTISHPFGLYALQINTGKYKLKPAQSVFLFESELQGFIKRL